MKTKNVGDTLRNACKGVVKPAIPLVRPVDIALTRAEKAGRGDDRSLNHHSGLRRAFAPAIFLVAACLMGPAFGQQTQGPVIVGAPVTPVKVTIKPGAQTSAPAAAAVEVPEGEPLPAPVPRQHQPVADPVFQAPLRKASPKGTSPGATESVSAPIVNVAGMTSASNPPDTTGDVGPNHFIQMVNATNFQIFNKAGAPVTSPASFGALWSPAKSNSGDPIVVYDHLADRWILSQFFTTGMYFAVSQTSDPTAGTWFLYEFVTGASGLPDYPKIGVWPDAFYMSSYESPSLGIYAFDRAKMLAGDAAGFVKTTIPVLTSSAGVRDTRILPVDLDGPAPPPGTPGYFVRTVDGQQDTSNPTDRIEIYEAQVDWNGPTIAFPLVNTLTPAAFNIMVGNRNGGGIRDIIPQPNTTATLDGLSNRPMMQLKYRYFGSVAKMVFCQTIDISGSIQAILGFTPADEVAGIRWYQLDKTGANWAIGQQGTFGDQPPGATNESQLLHRWLGSAAMNGTGDIAIGYSICNDDDTNPIFPGIRYTGRVASDPAGTLPQGEGIILNGTSSKGANGAYGQRWGDYAQMGVDPSDDSTFWFTTHVATGATRIASFTVSLPTGPEIVVEQPSGNALLDGISSRDFGVLPPGGSAPLTFTIRNIGSTSLTGLSVSKDGPDNADFTIGGLGSTTLTTGTSTTFTVTFSPSSLGARSAAIHIASNDADENPFDIALTGTSAVQEIAVEQPAGTDLVDGTATLDYGFVTLGSNAPLTFTVRNLGGADLTGLSVTKNGANSADFTIGSLGATTLPAGSSTTFTVTFAPGAQGARSAAIHIASNDADENPFDIALTGTGFVPEIAVEQPEGTNLTDGVSTVAYGNVLVGASSVKRFAIKNAGIGPLTVSSANLTGTSAAEFSIGTLSATSLQSGETAYLDVTFSPVSASAKSAALHIVSTDPDESPFDVAFTAAGTTLGGAISLLRDVNRRPNGLSIGTPVVIGAQAFFTGTTVAEGTELWRTDGTAAGTYLVKDIFVGTTSSSITSLTNFNGTLFFAANNSTNGIELWKSDGTTGGTVLVKDIASGTTSSSPANFTIIGTTLYFTANDATNGTELWKSDGTAGGTVIVANIAGGSTSSSPANLRNVNGTLYFTANDAVSGVELWKSDGSAGGTVMVKDIVAGSASSTPTNLTALGSLLVFTVNDGVNGTELWSSDGSSGGTALLKDINSGSSSSSPTNFAALGAALYFAATTATQGSELWRTDGTTAGTVLVKDIYSGASGATPLNLAVVGSTLYFSAFNSTNGREPWKSDGTTAGTVLLRDIAAGSVSSSPALFTEAGGSVYFAATGDGVSDRELWKTDGTTAGTVRVKDINPGSDSSTPASLANLAGTLIFSATDDLFGQELWKSDGTNLGTVMILEGQTGSSSAAVANLRAVNGTVFFSANDGVNGAELWKTDGTLAGTVLVSDIATGTTSSSPANLTNIGSTLYFTAFDSTNGTELRKSDGTAAGTTLVANIAAGTTSSSPTLLTPVGSTLFFSANDVTNGAELWKTDGTAGGTMLVKDINTTAATGSSLANLTSFNGTLFFSANDGVNGQELWKSDGTTAGTVMVKDINAGSVSSSPANLRVIGSMLFFSATTANNGTELWVSDGTTAGTVLVSDTVAGTSSSSPANLTVVGSTLFFSATNGAAANGTELWKSDGTEAGTVMVKDINAGTLSSSPTALVNVNGTLYFRATTSAEGSELWKSDGTAAGTVLVSNINPGTASSTPTGITNVYGTAFMNASTAAAGAELWQSIGTGAGTTQVADLMAGATSSVPANLTVSGTRLFFTARGPELGSVELFVVNTVAAPPDIVVEQPAGNSLVDGTATVDFGFVALGAGGNLQFTVGNTGTADLTGLALSIDGSNAGDFSVTVNPATPLASGASTTFTVQFSPSVSGVRTASLHIASNDPDENPFDITLTGVGSGTAGFSVPERMYYKFDGSGTPVPNLASAPVGSNPASIQGAMSQGGTGQFGGGLLGSGGLSSTDRLNTGWATSLSGSWTISLYLRNIPSSATLFYFFGDSTASTFRCFTNGVAGANNLMLRGTGITDVLVSNAAVTAATVTHFVYDATVPEIRAYLNGVLVNTVAQSPITISGAGPFLVGGYSASTGIPSGGVLDEFRLYSRALAPAEVLSTWNATLPLSASLPDIAVEQPAGTGLADGAGTINFGAVTLGANAVRTFTVRNVGLVSLAGLGVSKDGSNSADFTVGSLGAATLAPGASTTFNVTFAPGAAGARNAAIHIASSDPDENPFDVAVTGAGLTRMEAWKVQYFGSSANSGNGADGNDFEKDGMVNFLEFCLHTDPTQPSLPGHALIRNGSNLEFTYARAKAAVLDGITFTVQWTDELVPTNWNAVGVSQTILSDDGIVQQMKATLPAGGNGRRFVRLRAAGP
jgi:ELWxxDGT repeat protein